MSLFQSNLRKQIRNLPKILNFVKNFHYYSKLFTSLLSHRRQSRALICSLRLRSQPPSRGLAIQSRSLPSAAGCRKSHIVCESRSKDMLFFDLEPLINEKMICIVSRPELDERCLTVHSDSEFRARLLSDAADEVISCTTGN